MRRHEGDAGHMILSRHERNQEPVIVKAPGFATVAGQKVGIGLLEIYLSDRAGIVLVRSSISAHFPRISDPSEISTNMLR